MDLFIWIYISLTVFVNLSHTSTTLPTSTTDKTDGVTSVELVSLEVTSITMTTAESPTSATTSAVITQNPSVTASGDVSAFYTSTALPTDKTDNSGYASTSGVYLSTLSTITQEVTQPPATITTLTTQTPLLTLPGEGKEVKSNVVLIIIVVVITVIGTTAIIVVILILYTRRCKKRAAREDSKPDLATVQPFSTYESFRESNLSYAATDTLQWNSIPSAVVDASNHDRKNDETTVKCYNSVKKQKNGKEESGDRRNYRGDVMADEYEMKDVRMKFQDKLSNYDNLPVTEGKANNGKYSQVTNQSESVLASTEDEKSPCKPKKNNLVVDDDSDNKSTRTGAESHGAGDYSYVNPDIGSLQEKLSNLDDEDSYNHIGSVKTKAAIKDEKAICEWASSGKLLESAVNMNIASDNVTTEILAVKYD